MNAIRHLCFQLIIHLWDELWRSLKFVPYHHTDCLMYRNYLIAFLFILSSFTGRAQTLTLKEALNAGLNNYGTIRAKNNYIKASQEALSQTKRDYIPNVVLSAQQDYGTVNGQNGPLYGYGGFAVASSGLPLSQQNWNAGFGALYLANINWDVYTFGRTKNRINVAKATVQRDLNDLEQEQFQHQVRIAATYLNLLAAQRITIAQQKNLDRARTFQRTSASRASSGLVAGVDSTFANAEVSRAKIALTNAYNIVQEQNTQLAVLTGLPDRDFVLDSGFVSRIPAAIADTFYSKERYHPILKYYQSRIDMSDWQTKYYKKFYYPTISLFGIIQERGSGFDATYTQNQTNYTQDYGQGVKPTRGNYLLGVGMNWNLTTITRNVKQVKSQKYISDAMQDEYDLQNQQLKAQSVLADQKIRNAMNNYKEVPVQLKSASDAYLQKNTLYKNGLTTLVDVTQTLYLLNRAETDRDIVYNNVWQALLLKAAATGDLSIFLNEF